ncbi:hypothetical protein P7K49_035449, partial [Saguinus oedipus]
MPPVFLSQAESAEKKRTFFSGTVCSLLTAIDPLAKQSRQNRNTDPDNASDQVAQM